MNAELKRAAERLIELRSRISGEWRAEEYEDPRLRSWGFQLRGPRSRDHDNSLDAIEPDDAEFVVAAFDSSKRLAEALLEVAAALDANDAKGAREALDRERS